MDHKSPGEVEYIYIYHTSNLRKCVGVNGQALQLHAVYKKPYFYKSRKNPYQYYKSHENPYQVLQVMRESVSGTTSHVHCI